MKADMPGTPMYLYLNSGLNFIWSTIDEWKYWVIHIKQIFPGPLGFTRIITVKSVDYLILEAEVREIIAKSTL